MVELRSIVAIGVLLTALASPIFGQTDSGVEDADEAELARASQNPVGDLISLPFQNNLNLGVGPDERPQNVLNIQPVWPIGLGDNWNFITRTILPVMSQPSPGTDRTTGLGDVNFSGFFSPKKPGKIIWGLGPAIVFPTATDQFLGSEKWSLGPSLVVLTMRGQWVLGALVNNVWSVAGEDERDDVNFFLMQPFVNYNFPTGWYLTSGPILTANWKATDSDVWTVPVGGGFGKVFKIGKQPTNFNTQVFYNVARPDFGAKWQWRFQLQFLFPK